MNWDEILHGGDHGLEWQERLDEEAGYRWSIPLAEECTNAELVVQRARAAVYTGEPLTEKSLWEAVKLLIVQLCECELAISQGA